VKSRGEKEKKKNIGTWEGQKVEEKGKKEKEGRKCEREIREWDK